MAKQPQMSVESSNTQLAPYESHDVQPLYANYSVGVGMGCKEDKYAKHGT